MTGLQTQDNNQWNSYRGVILTQYSENSYKGKLFIKQKFGRNFKSAFYRIGLRSSM